MKKIPLSRGKYALVDDADFERLNKWNWFLYRTRSQQICVARYAPTGKGGRKRILMHRVVLGLKKGERCDHIDGNRLNNQRANLREITGRQNMIHCPGHGVSRFRGVAKKYRHSGGWQARIGNTYLGTFPTEEEAARAYNAAARKHYGKYAQLNDV